MIKIAKTRTRGQYEVRWQMDAAGRHWIMYGPGHCKCHTDLEQARADYVECIEHSLQCAGLSHDES